MDITMKAGTTITIINRKSSPAPSSAHAPTLQYTEGIIEELDHAQLKARVNFYSSDG